MPRKERLDRQKAQGKTTNRGMRLESKTKVKLPSGKQLTIKPRQTMHWSTREAEIKEQYLAMIRNGATNRDAAAACGCGTKYFQKRRKADPQFEQDYQDARADGDDIIRAEIMRRGVDGVKRAIYHDGKIVGYKQEYSDQLLMFLAESRMPEFKRGNQQVDVNVRFDGAAETLVNKLASVLGVKQEPKMIDVTPVEDV